MLLTGALLGLLSVVLGAFGAHALEARLTANGRVDTYELAVRYMFFHALAFLAVRDLNPTGGYFWLAGVVLFCGSLFALALTNSKAPYIVFATPLGGLMFIVGWVLLILAIIKRD